VCLSCCVTHLGRFLGAETDRVTIGRVEQWPATADLTLSEIFQEPPVAIESPGTVALSIVAHPGQNIAAV
jgi:hypothetical protein